MSRYLEAVSIKVVRESRIESVTVHARGAVVKRRAALGELPEGACDVVLDGVTSLAETGTLRASIDGAREVLGVRAELVVPDKPGDDGSLRAKLAEVRRAREDLVAARSHAEWRRELLASVQPDPDLVRRKAGIDPAERVADALAVVKLATEEAASLDASIAELSRAIEKNDRESDALRVKLAQASAAESNRDAPPELRIVVQLGPAQEGDAPEQLEVEYTVAAARWWPAYRARFTDGATHLSLTLSALVAQATGEDWSDVRLLLSTGDLLRDARLPELPSLRLGRAQKPRQRGYRPPPEGLDAMFEGFDRFVAEVKVTTMTITTASVTLAAARGPAPWQGADETVAAYDGGGPPPSLAHDDDLDEPTEVAAIQDLAKKKRDAPAMPMPQAPGFGGGGMAGMPMPVSGAVPMGAPAPMQESAGRMPARKRMAQEIHAPRGGGFFSRPSVTPSMVLEEEQEEDATLGGLTGVLDALPIEPADAWLDFDTLRIEPSAPHARRGRLTREPGPSAAAAARAAQQIDKLEPPAGTTDPRASRGLFDMVYSTAGTADVPSTGRPHRVPVITADAPAKPRFVTVPREAQEVYRRADATNPFGVPLLTGPVEVLIDGALAALTRLSYTDRGGVISIGLGVEERVRVARTSRIEEGTAGLLGGSTTVDHTVTTELSSSIGRKISVEVLDRLPVSDDKDIEIKLLSSQPKASPYSQADLGQPLRKGLRWEVEVPAGGKAKIEHNYRITLPSKMEIAGGNRRE
ncbi:MAG: DUF4139 domain-containing protein [Polyangiaceae bacterium]